MNTSWQKILLIWHIWLTADIIEQAWRSLPILLESVRDNHNVMQMFILEEQDFRLITVMMKLTWPQILTQKITGPGRIVLLI